MSAAIRHYSKLQTIFGCMPIFFGGINESVPGNGTTREQAPQGHKLPVLLPSPGSPVPGSIYTSARELNPHTPVVCYMAGQGLEPCQPPRIHPTGLSCMQCLPPHSRGLASWLADTVTRQVVEIVQINRSICMPIC
jgi:hypothetical protein